MILSSFNSDFMKRSVAKENNLGEGSCSELKDYRTTYSPSNVIAGPLECTNMDSFPGNASSVFAKQTFIRMLGTLLLLSHVLKV